MSPVKDSVNYELIAITLGDALKWKVGLNEIERTAKAALKVQKKSFPNEKITSKRAQAIYDWVMSLASSPLVEEEKKERLALFVKALIPDESDKVYQEVMKLLGTSKIVPSNPPDFEKIVKDVSLAKILEARWYEIQKCLNGEAYLAAIVMMGSLLEGLLLAVVCSHPKEANLAKSAPRDKQGNIKKFHEWTLTDLITVSYECGWIERDARDFSLELREYRNMVHPWNQRAKQFHPDMDTASICWEVVEAVLNDLMRRIRGVQE